MNPLFAGVVPGRFGAMRIVVDDGYWEAWAFIDYVEALCAGGRPSFLHKKFHPGPPDGECLVSGLGAPRNLLGEPDLSCSAVVMNSRTEQMFRRELERRTSVAPRLRPGVG